MPRKMSLITSRTARGSNIEWDPNSKEPWHLQFEKKPVNDKKWSCIVTAAVPTEAQDQEYIQIYNQYVSFGLRKAIKTITMSDIIQLFKENNNDSKSNKKEKSLKTGKNKNDKPKPEQETQKKPELLSTLPISPFIQIVELAAKYAVVTDTEVKLPPDLMAAVIKYLILILKNENCLQKKIDAVKERKIRERNIKAKFIRNLKPYEISEEKEKSSNKLSDETLPQESINDEPISGPDLYILLVDIYDMNVFFEFEKINVPFLAFLEISPEKTSGFLKDSTSTVQETNELKRKKSLIISFWEKYKSECSNLETVENYKNIATLKYEPTIKPVQTNIKLYKSFFDEMSWMIYAVHWIYRQHQKYLQELHVQRLIMSLEPLDLSRCVVYNKICDILILGQPLTPLLILYAIIEQVIAGVPETSSVALEYQPQPTDFFSDVSEDLESFKKPKKQTRILVPPCLQCKDKRYENICNKLKANFSKSNESSKSSEWFSRFPAPEEYNESPHLSENQNTTAEELYSSLAEYIISESILDQALSERISGKDNRNKKKWKTPSLCFFGDSVFVQTYHCQPRIFDTETFVERFLKNTDLPQVWRKFPCPPPGEKAFYNFHFSFLRKISKKSEEVLKLYIHFTMSMKLIGVAKSFMFKEDFEDENSDIKQEEDNMNKPSNLSLSQDIIDFDDKNDFNSYFYKNFTRKGIKKQITETKKTLINIPSETITKSIVKTDLHLLQKARNDFVTSSHTNNGQQTPYTNFSVYVERIMSEQKTSSTVISQQHDDEEVIILYALLNCLEISSLVNPDLISREIFAQLVRDYKFYETFEPYLMIQRLFEAQNNFNTTQFSYFPPTDTVIVLLYNDYDYRGVYFRTNTDALPTPVHFRDFYLYVYKELNNWLVEEVKEHQKFEKELQEKAKVERERKDAEYMSELKHYYCGMNEEEKQIFLETALEDAELEVTEKELEDLSLKPKPPLPNKFSFVGTNYIDTRVEFTCKTQEFLSKDGTEVSVRIEKWLYSPSTLVRVLLKRSGFQLYYNQWLEQSDIETSFTFKTTSGIIFSFYRSKNEKEEEEEQEEEEEEEAEGEEEKKQFLNYQVTVSWPTGLLIQPITINSTFYVKQSYIKIYRKSWDIELETSRCYVKNGQVVIFKEYGGYDILCPSGTKYTFFESGIIPRYEITTTTGEIWEIPLKGRCKIKKNLLAILKVFIGIDANETFYKREDGVYCMLWTNGKLVTTYPDGTKITTIPDFDENEIDVEWTKEEKYLLIERIMQSKLKSDESIDKSLSRSIHKNSTISSEMKIFDENDEKFVSISCSYLIEHPKYSSVYLNSQEGYVRVTMPEDIAFFIYPERNYTIQKECDFLKVCDTTVNFYKKCSECCQQSTATLFLDESEILCKCVDFFEKVFLVHRDGKATYLESDDTTKNEEPNEEPKTKNCTSNHNENKTVPQRCFALERDLSGVEFLHADSIAFYSDKLSKDTFFEINTEDPNNLCHTFTSPYYKVGHENWEMKFEDEDDSLPINLKKKDLKEMGVHEATKNVFKYPFPTEVYCGGRKTPVKEEKNIEMPKLIISRTIRGWPDNPQKVIDELQDYIAEYETKVHDIWNKYKNPKVAKYQSLDSRYVMMRLRKIALTLTQSLQMYPHMCTQFPSTEKEIHYFGHFINSMADMKSHFPDLDGLPDCKQIPIPLPRVSDFPSIYEENESQKSE